MSMRDKEIWARQSAITWARRQISFINVACSPYMKQEVFSSMMEGLNKIVFASETSKKEQWKETTTSLTPVLPRRRMNRHV